MASALFLADTVRAAGPDHRIVRAAPAPTATLAVTLATVTAHDLPTLLTSLWPAITTAATP